MGEGEGAVGVSGKEAVLGLGMPCAGGGNVPLHLVIFAVSLGGACEVKVSFAKRKK